MLIQLSTVKILDCKIYKKFTFTVILIIMVLNKVHAQAFDLGTWNILNFKYTQSPKLSFFTEGQIRSLKTYNQFHYYEFKGGVNYKIQKALTFTLAGGNYQTFKEGGNFVLPKNNNELRLWPQITLMQEINRFKIEQRYRLEMRWTSNGYRNRFRYRMGITYPFGENTKGFKPFQVSVSNELFFTNNEPYFERNRIQFTLNYKFTKSTMVQLGYLHQFDYKINDETGRDFLMLGFYLELFGKQFNIKENK